MATAGTPRYDPPDRAPTQSLDLRPAKTSAAAAFALVFGLSALLAALTGLLAPLAVLLGIIGIILGVVGMRMARRPGVTGRGVAIGGLTLAIIGLLLGAVVIGGVATVLNNDKAVNRIQQQLDKVKKDLPTKLPGQ